jgi:hypothetical protein
VNGANAKPVIFLIAGLLTAGTLIAAVDRLTTPRSPIPPTLFGMHIHSMVVPRPGMKSPDPWPPVPIGTWRVHDAYVAWPHLEPSKGQWKFSTLDKYVDFAEQHHVEVLLPLVLSPAWASSRPNEKSNYSAGNAAPPANLDDWQTYVRTVATRYKGRIHYYEIWNEPNLKGFFSGTPQEMVSLSREANKIIKAVDTTAMIISPSATGEYGVQWLDEFLHWGGRQFVDIIGFHFYVTPDPPEEMVSLIQNVRGVMQKYGAGDLQLWDTETGWRLANHKTEVKPEGTGFASRVLSDEEASSYVGRSYVIAWAMGLSRFYWYAWDNGVMGLTEADGATVKPPAKAYGEIENWLVGARIKLCDRYSGLWNCRLERDGGYTGNIIWTSGTSKPFELLPAWNMRQERDLEGRTRNITGAKTVQIGPEPILIENRAP